MSQLLGTFREVGSNPVLRRELDERAKSTRAVVAMTLWLVLLGGVASLVYLGYTIEADGLLSDPAQIGRDIFSWTLFGMIGLVLFLVPAFTASAIAGERTKQTLVPVLLSSMGPFAIVLGKTLAAIAFVALLLVATAPIMAVAFFVGGVGILDLLSGLGMVMLTALMIGSVGIAFSTIASKVQTSIVMSYGFVLAITIGSFIVLGVVGIFLGIINDFNSAPPRAIMLVNPFMGVASAVGDSAISSFNPMDGLKGLDRELSDPSNFGPGNNDEVQVSALWRWYVVFCALTIYTSMWAATNRLRTPMPVER